LGRATTTFLRATLGFEKEVIEQANIRLNEAEESALDHQKRAIRDPSTAHQSAIYPVGSEYALCHAETQLMGAVVAVLNESLTESLRGFYKLRKAFQTLYEISEAERKYIEAKGIKAKAGRSKTSVATFETGTTLAASEGSGARTPKDTWQEDDDDSDLEFEDAREGRSDLPTPTEYQGHLEMPGLSKLDINEKKPAPRDDLAAGQGQPGINAASAGAATQADNDVDFRDVSTDEIDLFIHSGTALCYGLLQLLLSMIPPTFAKLLSLFSFKGDRTNGLRLLWSATRFKTNINGGMASLITLGFHNGAIAFCDILSADALPRERLTGLLKEMRQLYPKSKLWLLEEARELSADHQLQKAVDITAESDSPSPLKQVEALRTFERSLNLMYLHRYDECAASFLKCIELNNWSHGLYYYIAGACHLELYRQYKHSGSEKDAAKHAARAKELFQIVPSHTGKKRFMARQLPFDVFTSRKLAKWTARAEQRGCDFVDAIGVSPLEEMIYFWSGYRRMAAPQLQDSLAALALSPTASAKSASEPQDEHAVASLLTATIHRFLGDLPAAKAAISPVLPLTQAALRSAGGAHADAWPAPVSHYEMAVVYWEEAGRENGDRAILEKCSEELKLVENAEGFDLDARVGLKVTTGRETLRRIKIGP
jgi:hypothetical protein